ncbi:hypothetical protein D3C78_1293630 [compost metagenome]
MLRITAMVPSSTRQVLGLVNSGASRRAPRPCAVSHRQLAVTTPAAKAMRALPKFSAIEPITIMSSQKCGLISEKPTAAINTARRLPSSLSASPMPPPPAIARRADFIAYQARKATPVQRTAVVSHGSAVVSVRRPATLAKMKIASMAAQVATTGTMCLRRMPWRRMKALWAPTTANRPMPVAAPLNQAPRPVLAEMTENMGFTTLSCLGGAVPREGGQHRNGRHCRAAT